MQRHAILLSVCCLLLVVTGSLGAQTDAVKADEETLRAAGLATDDAALLDFFRNKT